MKGSFHSAILKRKGCGAVRPPNHPDVVANAKDIGGLNICQIVSPAEFHCATLNSVVGYCKPAFYCT